MDFDKLIILREVNVFKQLSSEVLYGLSNEFQWKEAAVGEEIFSQGDEPDGLYIISSGKVSFYSYGNELSEKGSYGIFGEISVLSGQPRLATAIAEEDTMLLFVDIVSFNNISYCFPDILKAFIHELTTYLKSNIELLRNIRPSP